jgi:hypothetical protein
MLLVGAAYDHDMEKHLIDLLDAIEECYEKGRQMPCLVLLYSGIDVAASLERLEKSSVKAGFVKWVDGYMLPTALLNCDAIDLYAARCGVVHAFTLESDLSRADDARVVGHAFGAAELQKLNQATDILGRTQQVNVSVRNLIDAFRIGFADYLAEVDKDPVRFQTVKAAAGMWADSQSVDVFDAFLSAHHDATS